MKRIMFIAPRSEKTDLFDGSEVSKFSPPLGLLYIGSYIKDVSNIRVIDAYNRNYDDEYVIKEAEKFNPDLIVISINFFFSMKLGVALMKKMKPLFQHSIFVCGGNAATYTHVKLLKEGFDYVSLHEGETTFREIALCKESNLNKIEGLSYLKDGEVVSSRRKDIMDLDSLPVPDYTLLDGYEDYLIIISSSRGCPYDCFYCSTKQMWGINWRRRSAESIYKELTQQALLFKSDKRLKVSFSDDNFLVEKKRFLALASLIEQGDLEFEIGFSARIELVNSEVLEIAKKMGVNSMFFGVESGSSRMLKKLNRRYTKEKVVEVIKTCDDIGIQVTASFMVGIPGENQQDVKETFDLIRSLASCNIQVHVCTALPGTDMWLNPNKYGIISPIDKDNLGNIDHGASFDTMYFSRAGIDDVYMKAYALKTCKMRIR